MICKITREKIKPFMSFGKMPIANGFLKKKSFKKEFFFNLEVGFSKKISLFQINDHPKPEQMFNKTYPFFTGSSLSMIKHFKSYADWIIKNYSKNLKYLVEIGSNDGTFLLNFKKKNIKVNYISSPIMNQLSYHVSNNKIRKKGLKLKNNIDSDVKDTIKLLDNI